MSPSPRSFTEPERLLELVAAMVAVFQKRGFGVVRLAIGIRHLLRIELVQRGLQILVRFLGADDVGDLQHGASDCDGEGFVGGFVSHEGYSGQRYVMLTGT